MGHQQVSVARKSSWPRFLLVVSTVLGFFLQLALAPNGTDKMDLETAVSPDNSFDGQSFVELIPSGTITLELGANLSLVCNVAHSDPDLCFAWYLDSSRINVTQMHLVLDSFSEEDEGTYRCCVHSPRRNRTSCASACVLLETGEEATFKVPTKITAGIGIALLAVTALMVTLVSYFCVRMKRKNPPVTNVIPSAYEDPTLGSLERKQAKPEVSPGANATYENLQREDQDVYQELES